MKNLVILLVAIMLSSMLFCQDLDVEVEEAQLKSKEAQMKAQEMINQMKEDGETDITVNVTVEDDGDKIVISTSGDSKMDKPFIGITYSDMTLGDAAEIGYEYFYGIQIDTVVPNSPAYYYKLRTDDVLMAINDDKITQKDELGKIISFYRVGEKVTLSIFRKGEVIKQEFAFGTRNLVYGLEGNIVEDYTKTKEMKEIIKKKHRKDYGEGTIAWMPIWYTPEVEDVNMIMESYGFEKDVYSEDGLFLNGIALKGNIGKGWLIGGQYTEYFDKKTSSHLWKHNISNLNDSTLVSSEAKYWIRYGGLSFDKRFVIGSFYSEIGCMFTWGMNEIKVCQEVAGDVPNFDFEGDLTLEQYLDEYYNVSSSLNLKNYGFLAEPRISLGVRVNDWLSFKAEAAYLYSVSMSGWDAQANGTDINLTNKPDTNMDGLTLSFGPWFGF
ncbi:MAG: PDZ domain-containing protein [Candidatus Cloacimonetes bacterium]|nr:PDZ domain-containing protein [Candidatus Cloacimonadota bacterium]